MTRLLLLLCLFCFAACAQARPPLVVILLPGTSLQDWRSADAPHLHALMAMGALAVMNTRTARLPDDHARETPESAALTLGAGARAAAAPGDAAFLPAISPAPGLAASAGALYTRRTGLVPPPGRRVNLLWPTLRRRNQSLGYTLRPGNLADALAARQILLASGGGPLADLVAADGAGTVRRTNTLRPLANGCVVWDAGNNIGAADALIGRTAAQVKAQGGQLWVVSSDAGDAAYAQGRRLTPILEWGTDVPAGLLVSPSTRRAGLVTNTDFAPTLAAYYGLPRTGFPALPFGFAWHAVPAADAISQVAALEGEAETQRQGMKALPYLALALAVWLLAGTAVALKRPLPGFAALAPAVVTAAVLPAHSLPSLAIWSVALGVAVWGLQKRLGTSRTLLGLLAAVSTALIADVLTGSRLMHRGLLGYSAIEGARYYGIGNEAMGALVGSLLVLAARVWPSLGRGRGGLLLLLGAVSLLLGLPGAGAKAGGLLVSLAAFGTLTGTLLGVRWSWRTALSLAALVVLVMGAAALTEALGGGGAQSHIGGAVRRMGTGGISEGVDIVARKLAVESRLATRSAWACPLWGGLLCLILLWRRQPPSSYPERALRLGGAVAVGACALLNDAGVVAAVFCLLPLWSAAASGRQGTKKRPLEQPGLFQGPSAG